MRGGFELPAFVVTCFENGYADPYFDNALEGEFMVGFAVTSFAIERTTNSLMALEALCEWIEVILQSLSVETISEEKKDSEKSHPTA